MKPILTILFILSVSIAFSQANPWITSKNTKENPWLTEEQKLEKIEQEKLCEEERMLELYLKKQKSDTSNTQNSNQTKKTLNTTDTLTIDQKATQLQKSGINLYDEGLRDGREFFDESGFGTAAFFITLFPIVGSPIVWITAAQKPADNDLSNSSNPQNELLQNKEYKAGYKIGARKKRAGKMMLANLFGTAAKYILYAKILFR